MNAYREKLIANIISKVNDLVKEIDDIRTDEVNEYYELGYSSSNAEKYQSLYETVSKLDSASYHLEKTKKRLTGFD